MNTNFLKLNTKAILVFLFLNTFTFSYAQTTDSPKTEYHFSGSIGATNNGISFIPTFSLGKPAAIFTMSVGSKKLSFEPELRTSLEGKPWSLVLWGRYKMINDAKWKVNIGARPAIAFKTVITDLSGIPKNTILAQRYLAASISSAYFLTKDISIGSDCLFSRGIDEGTIHNTNFLALNTSFSNIKIAKEFALQLIPQLYYLKMDTKDGYFFSSALTLTKKNTPLSISAMMNKIIKTDINTKNFVWNATLAYSFNTKFTKQ